MNQRPNKTNIKNAIKQLKPLGKPNINLSLWQSISTLLFLWTSIFVSYWSYENLPPLLLISFPSTVIFMCRSYALEHDCGHYNLFKSKSMNNLMGTLLGFGVGIPYQMWKFIHNSHHNNIGNLTSRNMNPEVWTMTVVEYQKASTLLKIAYRFIRSKFVRLILTPTINYGIIFRLVHPKYNASATISVLVHDLIYAGLVYLALTEVPFIQLFFIFFLPLIIFYGFAAFTVYIQHQFENTYWEFRKDWDYLEASFFGSTLIDAPKWYKWLTGYIVYHNIHHLVSSIPNYNLEKARKKLEEAIYFPTYSMRQAYDMLNYKVWDEKKKKLVRFQ